ncbi:phosphoglycerate kinase [Catellatospora sp. TT07R-123]|uniref:histidine phosphatase family protein n=1 Tax=Catellatospora sp. TT07R-123 TaxID=2733863 RepID=UPI001B0AFAF1|nr:histidine phosphatase family protein [Catellatospora sp. TT07R-123]GHJ50162.1 phosphoglycerate kinase [Catellatospora sp. TT07R-123]
MTAWLIRHAESVANSGGATDHPVTIPLTERGRAQADHLAAALPGPPALIVTSGYLRTKQTAAPTRDRFPDVAHEEWPVQEFSYLASLHGRPTTAAQRRPMVDEYWRRADPHQVDGPDAESFADLLDRARSLLGRLHRRPDAPVAVFTHGVFMRAVLWAHLTEPAEPTPAQMRRFRAFSLAFTVPNTAVVNLRLDGDGGGTFRLGEVPHLPATLITGD